jgi:hypothetical protein
MADQPVVPPTDAKTAMKTLLIGSIRPLFFVFLGLAVLGFISWQIGGSTSILSRVNDLATARGLITFVVATATVAAAILLVLAAIISEGTESDIKMRLGEGRQVLAPLVGILGTVVGFYFGQAPASSAQLTTGAGQTQTQAQTLRLGAMTLSAEQAAPGGAVTVTSAVSGGTAPYGYTITLPGVGQPIAGTVAAVGEIKQVVTIPKDAKPQDVTIQLHVKDGAGVSAEVKSDRPLKVAGS